MLSLSVQDRIKAMQAKINSEGRSFTVANNPIFEAAHVAQREVHNKALLAGSALPHVMSWQEAIRRHTGCRPMSSTELAHAVWKSKPHCVVNATKLFRDKVIKDLPTVIDCSAKTTPIRNQGQCGSCHCFAAIKAIEGAMLAADSSLSASTLDLSEQDCLDCDPNTGGCNGDLPETTFKFAVSKGLVHEADCPYREESNTGRCATAPRIKPVNSDGFIYLVSDSAIPTFDEVCIALVKYNYTPLVICVAVDDYWSAYSSGIFDGNVGPDQINHAVTCNYADRSKGIIRIVNHWSTQWGEKGTMRCKYGANSAGYAAAGVVAVPVTPPTPVPPTPPTPVPPVPPMPNPTPTYPTYKILDPVFGKVIGHAVPVTTGVASVGVTSGNPTGFNWSVQNLISLVTDVTTMIASNEAASVEDAFIKIYNDGLNKNYPALLGDLVSAEQAIAVLADKIKTLIGHYTTSMCVGSGKGVTFSFGGIGTWLQNNLPTVIGVIQDILQVLAATGVLAKAPTGPVSPFALQS